jgi:urease accessory protein
MESTKTTFRAAATLLLGVLTPVAALAHPGHAEAGAGFMAGLMHPLSGLDHVLMIVAVSIWAAQLQPMGRVVIAASLALFVAIGALAPVAPPAGAGLEMAIALTVLGSGILLAAGRRWPLWAAASFAALFALIHGFAHGAEGPSANVGYVPGLVAATAGLALAVCFLAARLQAHRGWLRLVGILGAIAGTGALLNAG